ncbi:MAG: mycofactocin biosynthesis glycosyltransferase MftF [Frankiales bacterium]|nr:mycofactocin biosynthesis glycosyltransferase MftF [Frankiales bacterium]
MTLVLDRHVQVLAGGRVLLGGDPGRLVRLRADGGRALRSLLAGQSTPQLDRLGRTLLEGGLAHPRPGRSDSTDVTVVVPVRDRAVELDRCLTALGRGAPVLVVDDASLDHDAVRAVATRHGARLLRQDGNTGPGGARNAGVAATTSAFVAFVDSDCVVPPGWLAGLLGHFENPTVAAVAPRVRSRPGRTLLARYALARGPLDLGSHEARVRPGARVAYVPTAALVVRRSALGDRAFDPGLRFGEDVDLVWRLHDAGWTVRYDPRTVVEHSEPQQWGAWLRRRHHYGTSAGPLALRHGERLTPLVLAPWPIAAWLLLAARRPAWALIVMGVPTVRLHRRLRRSGLSGSEAAPAAMTTMARGMTSTASGLGGAGLVATIPLLMAALCVRRTRSTALVLLATPPLLELRQRRPAIDPVRWIGLRLVDDLAYASGVWLSCLTLRTTAPLRPRRSRPR